MLRRSGATPVVESWLCRITVSRTNKELGEVEAAKTQAARTRGNTALFGEEADRRGESMGRRIHKTFDFVDHGKPNWQRWRNERHSNTQKDG
jgi:hypothetical protein